MARKAHKGARTRAEAARLLAAVAAGNSLSELLRFPSDSSFDERDQAFIKNLCFGVCRWYPRLDGMLGRLLQRPLRARDNDLRMLLLGGMLQLGSLRVAQHAAVDATVEAARLLGKAWAAQLVNALLRRFAREQDALLAWSEETPVARFALPRWLLDRLVRAWPQHWQQIAEGLNGHPPMTLRVNGFKQTREDYRARLAQAGIVASESTLVPSALLLQTPMAVDALPGFVEGEVSVQDSGAQLAAVLLAAAPGSRVLDACAAPGGKTGHLLELAGGQLRLTALDISEDRLQRVDENLRRLGFEAQLGVADLARPLPQGVSYDAVLLDAPCSATGVIRRHPDIKLLRREADIDSLVEMQGTILETCWQRLRPGGRLLYSTCSLLPPENDEQIARFLANHPEARELDLSVAQGRRLTHGVQLLPGDGDWDGFFYALLEKT